MKFFLFLLGILLFFIGGVCADNRVPSWKKHNIDIETGFTWNARNNTPINYRIMPNQISWRSPYVFKMDLSNGSKLLVRHHFTLIADWVENGPEDHYIGLAGAPALEWWSASDVWSVYLSAGGGFGWTNSTEVPGGQGQDFAFNWYAKSGLRYQIDQSFGVFGGLYFQHLSNLGMTDPNPGIDAFGFTMGVSFSF